MADDKVIIELELDDGSIKKGFAIIRKEGEQTGKTVGSSLSDNIEEAFSSLKNPASSFSNLLGKVGVAAGLLGASILAIKKSVDLAFSGEKLESLNKQFESLSRQAGISSSVLLEGFQKAADGLVDTSDIMVAANKALVSLEISADKLPDVFEAARKASAVFGGDILSNFELLNSAIASGNTRSLRQIGIIVDSKKAIDDFAASLGVSADRLNQAGKQQAVLNAVLEKSKDAFSSVSADLNKNGNELQRLKTILIDLKEAIEIAFNRVLGPAINQALKGITSLAISTKDALIASFGSGTEQAKAKMDILTKSIAFTTDELERFKKNGLSDAAPEVQVLKNQLVLLEAQMAKLKKTAEKAPETMNGVFKKEDILPSIESPPAAEFINPIDIDKQKSFIKQLTDTVASENRKRIDLLLSTATSEEQISKLKAEKSAMILQDSEQKISQLRKTFRDLELKDTQVLENTILNVRKATAAEISAIYDKDKKDLLKRQEELIKKQEEFLNRIATQTNNANMASLDSQMRYASTSEELDRLFEEKKLQIKMDGETRKKILQDQADELGLSSAYEVSAARIAIEEQTNERLRELSIRQSQSMSEISKAGRQALVGGLVSAFSALGGALGKAQNGFQAFSNAVIQAIGNLAVQIGTMLVGVGLGFSAAGAIMPAWAVAGVQTTAAGLALITLGSAISASVGGGGQGGVAGATSSSSSGATATDNVAVTDFSETENQQRAAQVSVTIEGNVFDSKETGLRIADILNEHFDTSNGILAT